MTKIDEREEAMAMLEQLDDEPLSQDDEDHLNKVNECILKIFRREASFNDYLDVIEPMISMRMLLKELETNVAKYPRFKEVRLAMAKLCLERPGLPVHELYDEAVKLTDGEQPCH